MYVAGDELCPYKPVADRPDQFESKTVEGAIYNCPVGLVFDFEKFPCGCVLDANPERTISLLQFISDCYLIVSPTNVKRVSIR